MRFLGVDLGRRRIGLAVSDASALIASPWQTVEAGPSLADSVARIHQLVAQLRDPLDDTPGVQGVVIGLPRRLDGTDTELTGYVRTFATALSAATHLDVHFQDERLTSREAESLVARKEPDWRRRKGMVDAAAAALILQDFLDARRDAAREVSRP